MMPGWTVLCSAVGGERWRLQTLSGDHSAAVAGLTGATTAVPTITTLSQHRHRHHEGVITAHLPQPAGSILQGLHSPHQLHFWP